MNELASANLAPLMERAAEIASKARSENTRRAYAADWADFAAWCQARALTAMPAAPETVILYLTDLAERAKASTLARRLATISQAHQAAGEESPAHRSQVRLFLRALRRQKAEQGVVERGKRAILGKDLRLMLAAAPDTALGVRDRALLLVGYLGALRRSELVALNAADVELSDDGLILHLRRSKTDPEGKGEKRGIPRGKTTDRTCPVDALAAWTELAGIGDGPLFRPVSNEGRIGQGRLSSRAVARAVKRYAAAAKLDPKQVSGHSLRAGLATAAAMAGKSERAIMNQTGHRSVNTVRRYIRDGSLFRENAAQGLL